MPVALSGRGDAGILGAVDLLDLYAMCFEVGHAVGAAVAAVKQLPYDPLTDAVFARRCPYDCDGLRAKQRVEMVARHYRSSGGVLVRRAGLKKGRSTMRQGALTFSHLSSFST